MDGQAAPRGRELADRIARVAAKLFYREGIHLVGVDRVAAEAGVTKRTLYRYYATKDALVAAALRRGPRIRFPDDGPPRERVLGAFRMLAAFLRECDYRGCPYINAAAELTDRRHPGRIVIEELAARRRRWFAARAQELGVHAPDLLAEQLDVLFDGALAAGARRGSEQPAVAAAAAVDALIEAALRAKANAA
jgi:AcrR family transcriptional regulator